MVVEEGIEPEPDVASSAATSGRRGLIRNAAGSLGLNLVNVAATLLTTILLARILGVSEFGTYSFVIATVTLLVVPTVVGVDRLLTRDIAVYAAGAAYDLARGLLRRSQQVTLATSLAIGLTTAAVAWFAADGQLTTGLVAFWAGLAALPFLALGKVAQGGLMGLHHILAGQIPDYVLRPAVLVALVGVAAIGGVALDAPIAAALYTISVAVAAIAAIVLLYARLPTEMRHAVPAFRGRAWTRAAITLGVISGAAVLNSQVGITLLGLLSTTDSAGLYAVAQRGALLVAFPLAAVSVALAPTAARLWSTGERQRLQSLVTLGAWAALLAGVPLVVGYLAFGRSILTLLFGPGYEDAYASLVVLSVGQLVNAATGPVATLLIMTGQQRKAAVCIVAGTIINLVTAVVLIPTLDTSGAALAAAAALTISNVALVIVSLRELHVNPTALNFLTRSPSSNEPRPPTQSPGV